MEETLKLGDVVKLKSDSPWMTVISIESGYVQCVYYYNGEVKYSASIPENAFKKSN